ncbi:MAG: CarD family transcriptional regulator [Parvibaculum sp.]|uniref:CarD family transcriptional regulator n=1 Tax=Parvibaculum sp. TaxID=2024848 RepID=UPI00284B8677|nr:CarD family transcriptional regulator [Parvibaculum sp.]MDR3497660.1 CarD family transcriptional regulator [Parvibaculum sp.]
MTTKSKKTPHAAAGKSGSQKAKPQAAAKPAAKVKAKAASASVKPAKAAAKPAAKAKAAAPVAKAKPAAKPAPAKAAAAKPAEKKPAPKAAAKLEAKHAEPKLTGIHPKHKIEAAKQAAPVAKPAPKVEAKVEPKVEAKVEPKKPAAPKMIFKAKEFVVYPAHGVGQILDIEEQEVAGYRLELFVINFDKEKMTLRVPTHKAQAVGMRKLSDTNVVDNAIETLRGRARIKRTMWSRRAQEYEAKINSGDLISIAEVVRDLYRSERQPEQSYSERQLYEAALDRMAREVAVVERIGEDAAVQKVEAALQGGSGRGEKPAAKEETEAA